DDAHLALHGQGQRERERLLLGDVDRGLERVEGPALDRVASGGAVAAVADEAGEPAVARGLERADRVAALEHVESAGVELDQVDVIGPQTLERALDAGQERRRTPVGAAPPAGV